MSPELTTPASLRQFGMQMAIALPMLFGVLLPWWFDAPIPWWPFAAAAVFALSALIVPTALFWPHRLWMQLSAILGWVNTRLLLAVLFFVILTPLGLVLRLLAKLEYQRQPKGDSFWRTSRQLDADNMKDPF